MLKKASNATWIGKAVLDGASQASDFGPADTRMQQHPLPEVEVAWYDGGRVKITFREGCPAVIKQAYLSGQGRDLIVEFESQ
jgi:hypothetical protein